MASFSGTCEIVEASEETNSVQHSRGSYHLNFGLSDKEKLAVVKVGQKKSLEDDINQLFEAINLKDTSRNHGLSHVGTSPMRQNALKKPITVGTSRSPGIGISEPVSLKQALRELCLSKASEMAAVKRLSKSSGSSGASEAGRIKTLYNSVVVEASPSHSPLGDSKGSMVEISLVPEERRSSSQKNEHVQISNVKSSSKSAHSSPRLVIMTTESSSKSTQEQNDIINSSSKSGHSSPRLGVLTAQGSSNKTTQSGHTPGPSPSCSSTIRDVLVQDDNIPVSEKVANNVPTAEPGRKGRLQAVASSNSVNGNRVSKLSRNTVRSVKPVIRGKGFAKKKARQNSSLSNYTPNTHNEVNGNVDPSANQVICERCHCALKNAAKESNKDSLEESQFTSPEIKSSNGKSGANKDAVVKVKKNTRIQDMGEFSQSSKSSQGEHSSSTISFSDESNASGSSCGNRPHMSKDVRWEAIRNVQMQHGALSLTHFNLLKKLGCGDIGTVYLSELIGTNCLFAIKVMDNDFLARRKKMPRAQTEREILRMLDHPFLPTLYSQFTSDNLSCLVMEYCPGGDLHVLRQKQPGRIFTEPAARFYVAEVLLALEYLHMLGVIYRDLKPENILVREDGHIMLTDFDLSLRCTVNPTLLKSSSFDADPVRISGPCTSSSCAEPFCIVPSCQVPCFSPRFLPSAAKARKLKADLANHARLLPQLVAEPTDARSNSFVGTHEYLAPEIIKGEGHGAAVDWWTFGVFLYELLYGRTPFKGPNNEETLVNVVLQSLKFPDCPLVSFQARDLIRGLLVKEPENRFGSEKGAAEIKQHPFFEGLNWALIRCAIPPELPDFSDFEVSNLVSQEDKGKYLEYKANGEHLEFELF